MVWVQAKALQRTAAGLFCDVLALIEVLTREDAGLSLRQTMVQPVVYLDHWAVRLFSDDLALQDRFVAALLGAGGTLLFSSLNLMEFVAMERQDAAISCERFLARLLPALYVADTPAQAGFLLEQGAPVVKGSPEDHWMLRDLGLRFEVAGALTVHRFVQDAIDHREQLLPLFEDTKATVTRALREAAAAPPEAQNPRTFRPRRGMKLRDALLVELMREPILGGPDTIDLNDSMDLMHAASCAVACDFILLDGRWSHRLNISARRLRQGGVTGHLARGYSKKLIPNFLADLERLKQTSGPGG